MSFPYSSTARLQVQSRTNELKARNLISQGGWLKQIVQRKQSMQDNDEEWNIFFQNNIVSTAHFDAKRLTGSIGVIQLIPANPSEQRQQQYVSRTYTLKKTANQVWTAFNNNMGYAIIRFSASIEYKLFITMNNLHFALINIAGEEYRLYHMQQPPVYPNPIAVEQGGKEIQGYIQLVGLLFDGHCYLKDLFMLTSVEQLQFLCALAEWGRKAIAEYGSLVVRT